MEHFDISNIEEVITDWFFGKNDEMERLALEFTEVDKNEAEGTFSFSFRRGGAAWKFKYEASKFSFETNSGKDADLVMESNQKIMELSDTSPGVIEILESFTEILKDHKKKISNQNVQQDDQEMEVDEDWDNNMDENADVEMEEEGED